MKKFLLILISLIIVIVLAFYGYRAVIFNNMQAKERELDSVWGNVYKSCGERVDLLKTLTYPVPLDKFAENHGLKINTSVVDNKENSKKCTLEFKEKEFTLNSIYLSLLSKNSNDSLFNENKKNALIRLQKNDTSINNLIKYYNSLVLDYNKYLSLFPNFIFAKQKGYRKKLYFEINYGVENKDPKRLAKELPEWAKGVDTAPKSRN